MNSLILSTTILLGLIAYGIYRFTTRVSPGIPYAGEESLWARLQVPVEYSQDPIEFLRKTRRKLGDVFCVDLFLVKFVFFLGPKNNRMIFRAHEEELSFWDIIEWTLGPRLSESEYSGSLPYYA